MNLDLKRIYNKIQKFVIITLTVLVVSFIACKPTVKLSTSSTTTGSSTIYLVRHAEKMSEGDDPDLTKDGRKRAKELAKVIQDVTLHAVYSSNYLRTKNTAKPVAEDHGLPIMPYNPRELDSFASKLKDAHKSHNVLVVGHSNSTPSLVNALIGDEKYENLGEKIYDRLYIVMIDTSGQIQTRVEKFGLKSQE